MNKFTSLLAIQILFFSPSAWAEADRSGDLRYCLDLPSSQQIAKCSGEISPGGKSRTYSKAEVAKILSEANAETPTSPSNSSDIPAASSDVPNMDLLPAKTESDND